MPRAELRERRLRQLAGRVVPRVQRNGGGALRASVPETQLVAGPVLAVLPKLTHHHHLRLLPHPAVHAHDELLADRVAPQSDAARRAERGGGEGVGLELRDGGTYSAHLILQPAFGRIRLICARSVLLEQPRRGLEWHPDRSTGFERKLGHGRWL